MTVQSLVLYGRELFGRTLYSVNSTSVSPINLWIEVEQDNTGIWTEVDQF
jgi:hypothetical protein